MKLIALLLFSFTVRAGYLPKSKFCKDTTGVTSYSKKAPCEVAYSEVCLEIPKDYNPDVCKVVGNNIDIDEEKEATHLAQEQVKKDKKVADDILMETIKAKLLDGSAKLEDIVNYIKIKEGL